MTMLPEGTLFLTNIQRMRSKALQETTPHLTLAFGLSRIVVSNSTDEELA